MTSYLSWSLGGCKIFLYLLPALLTKHFKTGYKCSMFFFYPRHASFTPGLDEARIKELHIVVGSTLDN